MNKKKILSLALVVLLICTISFGTLAWFNATDEVTNKFYVADSDGDGKPNFSIEVTENPDNKPQGPGPFPGQNPGELPDETTPDGGHAYHDILPGSRLNKDASVKNTGDYNQWVRVHLIFSDADIWKAAIAKAAAAETRPPMTPDQFVQSRLFTNLFRDGFNNIHFENNGDAFGAGTLTYTFYYTRQLAPGEEFKVLDSIVIPGVLEQEDMNFGTDGFTLTIKAEAVQVKNLNATNAFDAFKEVGWEVGSEYGE